MRSKVVRPLAVVLAAGAAASAHAQVDREWNNAAGGDWSTAANWTPADVPDNAGENAVFSLAGPYTAALDISTTIFNLLINDPDVVLEIELGRALTINGDTIVNNGIVSFNLFGSAADSAMNISLGATVSGTGAFVMRAAGADARIEGPGVLTQTAGHTILGVGRINAPFINAGNIRADVSVATSGNRLEIEGANKTNSGTIGADDSSILEVTSTVIDQTPTGVIRAFDGGLVRLQASTINGGTVDQNGTGVIEVNFGTVVLDSVTNTGLLTGALGTTTLIDGTGITNNGIVELNPLASAADSIMRFAVSGTLGGTGEVHLRASANDSRLDTDGGAVITQSPTHTVRGIGRVNATMINNGGVWADIAVRSAGSGAFTLELETNDKDNNGQMGARAGSVMQIEGIQINQTGGGTLEADAGAVNLRNATILGGAYNSTGGGILQSENSSTNILQSVTLNGPTILNLGSTTEITGTGLTNNGVMELNPLASAADVVVRFEESGVLDGTGEMHMRANFLDARFETADGVTMTQASGHAIRGIGTINGSVVNNGEIRADIAVRSAGSGGTLLELQTNDKTNNAFMVAAAGSRLEVEGITIDQTGGGMMLAEDGEIELRTATINGGMIGATGTGFLEGLSGINTLRSVTLSAPTRISPSTQLSIEGTGLVNDATMLLNPIASAADAVFVFTETGDLTGAGELLMQAGFADARVETAAGQTMTQGANHSIRGVGTINASVINDGTISADLSARGSSGSTLLSLATEPKGNRGVMSAEAGATLGISTVITQTGGGELVANDGEVSLLGATIDGGTIRSTGTGFLDVDGNSTIRDVTLETPTEVSPSQILGVEGTITNRGSIVINPTGSAADGVLDATANATIIGVGEVVLAAGFSDSQIVSTGGTLTFGQNQTVRGFGRIGADATVRGDLKPDRPGASVIGAITMDGTLTLTPTAEVEIEIIGTSTSQFDRFTGGGTWNLGGTLRVIPTAPYTPTVGDAFTLMTGAINGEFDDVIVPLPPLGASWRVLYLPAEVRLLVSCAPDFTGSSDPNDPTYGIPDGDSDGDDFFFLLDAFETGDTDVCDLTGSSDPNEPSFRMPDGDCDADDFFHFLDLFAGGCP